MSPLLPHETHSQEREAPTEFRPNKSDDELSFENPGTNCARPNDRNPPLKLLNHCRSLAEDALRDPKDQLKNNSDCAFETPTGRIEPLAPPRSSGKPRTTYANRRQFQPLVRTPITLHNISIIAFIHCKNFMGILPPQLPVIASARATSIRFMALWLSLVLVILSYAAYPRAQGGASRRTLATRVPTSATT
jgi:hypothetical protein